MTPTSNQQNSVLIGFTVPENVGIGTLIIILRVILKDIQIFRFPTIAKITVNDTHKNHNFLQNAQAGQFGTLKFRIPYGLMSQNQL